MDIDWISTLVSQPGNWFFQIQIEGSFGIQNESESEFHLCVGKLAILAFILIRLMTLVVMMKIRIMMMTESSPH